MPQDSTNDLNATNQTQGSNDLTTDMLRQHIKDEVKRLHEDVFGSLRASGTDSLLIYLITISLRLAIEAYQRSPFTVDDLLC